MVVKHLNDQTSVVQTLGMQHSETCQNVYHLIYAAKLAEIQNLEGVLVEMWKSLAPLCNALSSDQRQACHTLNSLNIHSISFSKFLGINASVPMLATFHNHKQGFIVNISYEPSSTNYTKHRHIVHCDFYCYIL
jgi:hypothetical protein